MNGRYSEPLASYGSVHYVRQCEEEVLLLDNIAHPNIPISELPHFRKQRKGYYGAIYGIIRRPDKHSSSIDLLTDNQVKALIDAAVSRNDAVGITHNPGISWMPVTAWKIAPDAVAKKCNLHEPYLMTYIASRSTSIHIPRVRRVLPMHKKESLSGRYSIWLVMDFIDGNELETAWPQMSWWNRLWTIWKLRKSIRELHQIPVPRPNVPGPFDSTGKALACSGYYFSETGTGPFESYSAMADWFDHLRYSLLVDLHMNYRSFKPHLYPMFDISHPLVLCYMDLNMRNIIVDKRGDVWLVDWGMDGAFPPWFEYANMVLFARAAIKERRLPKSWVFFAPFVAGNYQWYEAEYLRCLEYDFERSWLDHPKGYFERLRLDITYRWSC
ncbi:kinase-like protein [Desarmillaria tabescens]|uniref:Kinase-like protein n=1 Tax=Armillaria tabescens TaxID=1929756 RepID=A0AA39MKZ5_ARMTA|nr:kinase-like protein [Desarmillaria tabescens]KAK0438152.1 kinase-like protein [Desarmillaria tabescens]